MIKTDAPAPTAVESQTQTSLCDVRVLSWPLTIAAYVMLQVAHDGDWRRLRALWMQLRKCCNHPYLFKDAEPDFDGETTGELRGFQSAAQSIGLFLSARLPAHSSTFVLKAA